jgi:putative Holliday junction resolvase
LKAKSYFSTMHCLGLDYGTRRVGVAYGDDLGVATPLPALVESDPEKRWKSLGALMRDRRITDIVLGYPLNMDGTAGAKAREAEAFAGRLKAAFGVPVHLVDERLTSYEAESTVERKRRRALRASGIVDSRAATLILQDFLNQRIPGLL